MNIPGFDFHRLSGARKATCSVQINVAWCMLHQFFGFANALERLLGRSESMQYA